jgi:hypothetical protein
MNDERLFSSQRTRSRHRLVSETIRLISSYREGSKGVSFLTTEVPFLITGASF